jgi:sn1-specific diacylglycerol lipase
MTIGPLRMDFTRSTLLPLASGAAKLGFGVGRWGTNLGFQISRTVTSSAVQLSAAAVDYGLGWSNPSDGLFEGPTTKIANGAVMMGFNSIEWIVGKGIDLSEYMTQSSLEAVSNVVESISDLYGGTQEASFSLGAFVQLVRRELANPSDPDSLPAPRNPNGSSGISAKSAVQVARSLAAWAAIQTMTVEYQEQQLLKGMREVDLVEWRGQYESEEQSQAERPASQPREDPQSSPVHITSEIQDEESHVRITTAELGLPGERDYLSDSEDGGSQSEAELFDIGTTAAGKTSYWHDRRYLRRMSKICLGSYGGAGLIFFGAPLPGATTQTEEVAIPHDQSAVDGEAIQKAMDESNQATQPSNKGKAREWWNNVRGHNDEAIFKHYASIHEDDAIPGEGHEGDGAKSAAAIAAERSIDSKMPRFWVLTDHRRREVVLALRG